MGDFVTPSCPSCGGKLQITNDVEQFACAHCGARHIVKRAGGPISLAPVVEGLRQVQTGVDKTASELAIKRLDGEIAALRSRYTDALAGPGSVKRDSGCWIWVVVVFLLALGGGLYASIADKWASKAAQNLVGVEVVLGVGLIALCLYGTSSHNKSQVRKAQDLLQQPLGEIDPRLQSLEEERQRHIDLVSQ